MLSAVKKKLENFFIQNLEKQIKGPLILFHSDVAIVNKALFFFSFGEGGGGGKE